MQSELDCMLLLLLAGAYEAVTFALSEKNNWQVRTVRMILDIIMVVCMVESLVYAQSLQFSFRDPLYSL